MDEDAPDAVMHNVGITRALCVKEKKKKNFDLMIIKGAMCLHVSVLCRLYKSQNSLYIFHEIKLMNVRDAFKDQ